jgi:hypothetical protein
VGALLGFLSSPVVCILWRVLFLPGHHMFHNRIISGVLVKSCNMINTRRMKTKDFHCKIMKYYRIAKPVCPNHCSNCKCCNIALSIAISGHNCDIQLLLIIFIISDTIFTLWHHKNPQPVAIHSFFWLHCILILVTC